MSAYQNTDPFDKHKSPHSDFPQFRCTFQQKQVTLLTFQPHPFFSSSSSSTSNRSNAPTEICNSRREINIETIIRINAIAKVHCPAEIQPAKRANMLMTQNNRLSTPKICILRIK